MFLSLDGTFFVQLINFAIFFAILNVVFLRPVGAAIAKRRAYINSLTQDYETYNAEINGLKAAAEAKRAAARRDADAVLAKVRAEISNETAQLSGTYAQQVTAKVEEAHKVVASEVEAARANESKLVRDLADMMLDRAVYSEAKS